MSLSSLIVHRGLATIRDVEEALARQVLYGGDLTTNLLEVVRVDEDLLEPVLGEAFGIEAAPPRELPMAPTDALRVVSAEFASTHGVYPLSLEGGTLVIAVIEPLAADVVSELGFATGLFVAQRIATALRVREAISKTFGLPLERRFVRLLARLRGEEIPHSIPPPPSVQPAPVRSPHTTTQRLPSAPPRPPSVAPPAPVVPKAAPAPTPPLPDVDSAPRIRTAPLPPATGVKPPPVAPPPPSRIPDFGASAETRGPATQAAPVTAVVPSVGAFEADAARAKSAPPQATQRDPGAQTGLVKIEGAKPRPPRRRRGPLTTDAAKAELEEAVDRDTVFDVVFDFTRQFFEYTAAFVVHGDLAEGRDAFGSGCSRDTIVEVGIPLAQPSVFWQARAAQSAIKLKASPDGLDPHILDALSLRGGSELAILPIVVRKRAVAFIVGDAGGAGVDPATLRELASLGHLAGTAFERLILRKKLGADLPVGKLEPPSTLTPPPTQASPLVLERLPIPAPAPPSERPPSATPASDRPRPDPMHMLRPDEPPPATVVAVRRPSGPPIPREESNSMHPISSEQSRSVPARKPPSSRNEEALPSVIVATDEFSELVTRYLERGDDHAETALLHAGQHAMPAIMARFPGPLTTDIVTLLQGPLVRASECGPLLKLICRQRRVALPFVLGKADDIDERIRFWAVYLASELPYVEAIRPVVERLFDPDARVRMIARTAARSLSEQHAAGVVERIAAVAADLHAPISRRVTAVDALGELREALAVPLLIHALADAEPEVAATARSSLVLVLRHDFGRDPATWLEFWRANAQKPRPEWLIDALAGDDSEQASAAAEELTELSKNNFGFANDLSLEERRAVRTRFLGWWLTEGSLRGVRV